MIGAIIGDVAGSRFEFNNHRSKDFDIFARNCSVTDDSIMTLAVGKALLDWRKNPDLDLAKHTVEMMQEIGRPYPGCGFGGRFYRWMYSDDPQPYYSYGNGAAMRVSPVGYFADTMDEAKDLSAIVTGVTHNHPEGLKGAEATACLVWGALHGWTKEELLDLAKTYYDLDFTIDEIRPFYQFNETCQNTVPQALEAFFESDSFEDAIRTAVSVGGDSDTLACITGGIAGAFYGVPSWMQHRVKLYFDPYLLKVYKEIETGLEELR